MRITNKLSGGSARSRSFRYGSVSTVLSIVLIVSIILVNIIFTMLARKFNWYIDMTKSDLFTLSEQCFEALKDVDEDVTIYFCDMPDNLDADLTQQYVHYTALELAERMPNIHVEYLDIWSNPTSVDRFKRGSDDAIYSHTVIFESGTEWRTHSVRSFYTFNSASDDTPWAYSGEKTFTSAILAVTKADSPIACFTNSHGESFSADNAPLISLLESSGYKVQTIDLMTEEIPEDCRLMIIYNPQDDFISDKDGVADRSEIKQLDKFLDGLNAMMVFMNPDTAPLPNLEEYLEEWGIKFLREENKMGKTFSCKVKDTQHSLTQDGLTVLGEYTTAGLGASIHKPMRESGTPAKIVFRNVMPIVYPDSYSQKTYLPEDQPETSTSNNVSYTYGYYSSSAGVSRECFDVFTSYDTAKAISDGNEVASASAIDKFKLMTVTREQRMIDDSHVDSSYVWACGSVDFGNEDFINSNTYGNADLLLYSLHTMGKEYVPVELEFKVFDNTEIEGLTTAAADAYTWTLILVPPIVMFAVGTTVIVRRKYR